MHVADVMSSPAVVATPDTPIKTAAARLAERGFTSMPVVVDAELVGMVSEADLLAGRFPPDPRVPRHGGWDPRVGDTVGEVMRTDVLIATPRQAISEVLGEMRGRNLRSAPVVEHGVVVGMVTFGDLMRALARDDDLIAGDVQRRIGIHAGAGRWRVEVSEGEVTLIGDEPEPAEKGVLERIAESVIGVTGVRFASPVPAKPRR
jgi:CBS domain-containing protein